MSSWIPLDDALLAAQFSVATDIWSDGQMVRLQTQPVVMFAPNREPGFYLFDVIDAYLSKAIARIWISADTAAAAPIAAVERVDAEISLLDLFRDAMALFHRSHVNSIALDSFLVVYSYPKIGCCIEWFDPATGDKGSSIIDLYTGLAPDVFVDDENTFFSAALSLTDDPDDTERDVGASLMSNIRLFMESFDHSNGGAFEAGQPDNVMTIRKLGRFYGNDEGDFPFISQNDEWHCTLASAEMILKFFDPESIFNQISLENPFGYEAGRGTTTAKQLLGYNQVLSSQDIVASADFDPKLEDVSGAIDNGFPLRSSIPGHARCCCGYRKKELALENGSSLVISELLIHDPYPPQSGQIRWEPLGAVRLDNFVCFTAHTHADKQDYVDSAISSSGSG